MLIDELAAPPARGDRDLVTVDSNDRDKRSTTATDQLRHHAALGTQRHPVPRVLNVAPTHDSPVLRQSGGANGEPRVRAVCPLHRVNGTAQQGIPIDRRHRCIILHFM